MLAGEQTLHSPPGMQQLSAKHWRLGLDSEAEQQQHSYGIELFQDNQIAEAAYFFKQALMIDPTYAEALCFLGIVIKTRVFLMTPFLLSCRASVHIPTDNPIKSK